MSIEQHFQVYSCGVKRPVFFSQIYERGRLLIFKSLENSFDGTSDY